eukprot:scaffold3523_cov108-Isochrysis_galbana.AAC.4
MTVTARKEAPVAANLTGPLFRAVALAQESRVTFPFPISVLRASRRRVSTTGGANPSRTSWSVEGWIHSKKRNRLGGQKTKRPWGATCAFAHKPICCGLLCWKRAQTTDSEESEKVLDNGLGEEMEIEEPDEGEEDKAC